MWWSMREFYDNTWWIFALVGLSASIIMIVMAVVRLRRYRKSANNTAMRKLQVEKKTYLPSSEFSYSPDEATLEQERTLDLLPIRKRAAYIDASKCGVRIIEECGYMATEAVVE